MSKNLAGMTSYGLVLVAALGTAACTTILTETAKKALEDRTGEDQVTDTKIGAGILGKLSDKDKGLLLDVNADVWEQRVMLTGTLSDPKVKDEVVKLVRDDPRIKELYDEITIVPKEEQEKRREAAKQKDEAKKEESGGGVNDFWIDTKLTGKLITEPDVRSVNFRWRVVRNVVYLIGRARSKAELDKVFEIIRGTEGVKDIKHFVVIRPVTKAS